MRTETWLHPQLPFSIKSAKSRGLCPSWSHQIRFSLWNTSGHSLVLSTDTSHNPKGSPAETELCLGKRAWSRRLQALNPNTLLEKSLSRLFQEKQTFGMCSFIISDYGWEQSKGTALLGMREGGRAGKALPEM